MFINQKINDLPQVISYTGKTYQVEDQCDCACSVSIPSYNHLILSTSKTYLFNLNNIIFPLKDNQYIVINRDFVPVILNYAALALAKYFDTEHFIDDIPVSWYKKWGNKVITSTIKKLVDFKLLVPTDYINSPLIEKPTILSAWLHITDRCNLRCSYCYLPHNNTDMSMDVGKSAIDATFRSAIIHNYTKVKLKYAGGEAMLRFSFITELHRYAMKLAVQHNIALDGVILSNGTYLTTDIIETIQALGLRLMISLDGLNNVNNSQRAYVNGSDSSADVVQSIELALKYNVKPDISITVSGRNVEELPKLIKWILKHKLHFGLNFYRENDVAINCKDLQLEEEKIISGMLTVFKVIESNLPHQSLLTSLIDRANLLVAHLRTCSVGNSYLVFNHLGQVFKCQMQMNQPITTAKIEDPLALIQADKFGIQNLSVEKKEECKDCEWKYWCTGSCPLTTYKSTGYYDVKSPNCNIYKALYPKVIYLEGLRLLKDG